MKISRSKSSDKGSLDAYFSKQIRKGPRGSSRGEAVDYEKVRSDWMKRLGDHRSR